MDVGFSRKPTDPPEGGGGWGGVFQKPKSLKEGGVTKERWYNKLFLPEKTVLDGVGTPLHQQSSASLQGHDSCCSVCISRKIR